MYNLGRSVLLSALIVPPLALSAETELPQTSINKINEDFLKNYQINLSCSRGVAYPQVDLFAKGENIFMLRDSNSSFGYSVAELKEPKSGEFYHSGGMRFFSSNLANTNDFYISAETLKKGEGELTVVLYRDIYKCNAKLDTWSVSAAERTVEREIQAVVEAQKMEKLKVLLQFELLTIIERAVHRKVILDFQPPPTARSTSRAIFRFKISRKDGVIGSFVPVKLSLDVSFQIAAQNALEQLNSLNDLELDDVEFESMYKQMEQAGMDPSLVFRNESPLTGYVELNMTGDFVPVPQEFRR